MKCCLMHLLELLDLKSFVELCSLTAMVQWYHAIILIRYAKLLIRIDPGDEPIRDCHVNNSSSLDRRQ
jgi:hypothetical protein